MTVNNIASVTFDSVLCFEPRVVSTSITDTTISSCDIPPNPPGPVNVVVTDVFGATATAVYTYYDVPSAPLNLSATPSTNSVGLTWQAPSTDNYSTITDYVVQYSDDNGDNWVTVVGCTGTTLSCDVTGLLDDELYQFRVAAVNAAGQGPWSNIAASAGLFLEISSDLSTVNIDSDLSMGYMSSAATTVNVKTNNVDGYSLTVTAANTSLVHSSGSPQISTLGSTNGLVGGTAAWGWRIGGDVENGVASSQYNDWRPMQSDIANAGALIDQTSAPNADLPTDAGTDYRVLYGAAAGLPQAPGTYGTEVVYTLVGR